MSSQPTVPSSPAHAATAPSASPVAPTQSKTEPAERPTLSAADRLPITNIDDVEVSTPTALMQRRTTNTITVVPIRKPEPQPASPEAQDSAAGSPVTGAGAGGQAPYAQLGTLLKKRYPAVDEIEVIGGYLSLGRSCLSKTSSTGKKVKWPWGCTTT